MEHRDKMVVHHHSFTQHPEEGSQEEVVEQEGHYLAGNLGRSMEEPACSTPGSEIHISRAVLKDLAHLIILCSFNPS